MSSVSSPLFRVNEGLLTCHDSHLRQGNGCLGMVVKLAPGIEPGWQTLSQASSGEPSGSSPARPKRSGTGSGRRVRHWPQEVGVVSNTCRSQRSQHY